MKSSAVKLWRILSIQDMGFELTLSTSHEDKLHTLPKLASQAQIIYQVPQRDYFSIQTELV